MRTLRIGDRLQSMTTVLEVVDADQLDGVQLVRVRYLEPIPGEEGAEWYPVPYLADNGWHVVAKPECCPECARIARSGGVGVDKGGGVAVNPGAVLCA
jgi:hypothetical protein